MHFYEDKMIQLTLNCSYSLYDFLVELHSVSIAKVSNLKI